VIGYITLIWCSNYPSINSVIRPMAIGLLGCSSVLSRFNSRSNIDNSSLWIDYQLTVRA